MTHTGSKLGGNNRQNTVYGKRNYWQKGLSFLPIDQDCWGLFCRLILGKLLQLQSWAIAIFSSTVVRQKEGVIFGGQIRANQRKLQAFSQIFFPAALRYCTKCAIPGNFLCHISLFSLKIVCFPFSLKKAGRRTFAILRRFLASNCLDRGAKRPFDPSSWQHIFQSKKAITPDVFGHCVAKWRYRVMYVRTRIYKNPFFFAGNILNS